MSKLYRHSDIIARNCYQGIDSETEQEKRLKPLNIWNQMAQSSKNMSTIVPTIKDNRLFAVDVHREVADKEAGMSWSTRIIHHFSIFSYSCCHYIFWNLKLQLKGDFVFTNS